MSTARKTRPDNESPSLRQRAKASRATAARVIHGKPEGPTASPGLVALVDEWQENMRLQNYGDLSDEEAEPIFRRNDEVQRAILAYPVKSVVDLRIKLPVFRDELEHTSGPRGPHGKEALDHAAWVGVIRDIERLAPAPLGTVPIQCAAGQIADLMEEAIQYWHELDNAGPQGAIAAANALRVERKIQMLGDAVSYARAASPGGMLCQLAIASHAIESVLNGVEHLREPAQQRAERCLLSVAAAICSVTGIARDGYGAGYHMPARYDELATLSPKVV
ncbi:hypothetical protein [Methylobacterium sp. J-090]|uniref:hypothetical protein n=1 Tax=Methylobacterium sp. J-090 TaxID=2836666 RepID=UPI001FB9CEC7|nr:hypothetical protein [Methylobacterium sp. J-090]MCJ2082684.1 hypothetical protein [Methylobacterium sp. J-090]